LRPSPSRRKDIDFVAPSPRRRRNFPIDLPIMIQLWQVLGWPLGSAGFSNHLAKIGERKSTGSAKPALCFFSASA